MQVKINLHRLKLTEKENKFMLRYKNIKSLICLVFFSFNNILLQTILYVIIIMISGKADYGKFDWNVR